MRSAVDMYNSLDMYTSVQYAMQCTSILIDFVPSSYINISGRSETDATMSQQPCQLSLDLSKQQFTVQFLSAVRAEL